MPLLKYFGAMGPLLTALLLLVSHLLEPPRPANSRPVVAIDEVKPPQPRTTDGTAGRIVDVTRAAPGAEARSAAAPPPVAVADRPEVPIAETASTSTQLATELWAAGGSDQKSLERAGSKGKAARARPRERNVVAGWGRDAYASYARERAWSSAAQGTLGPH